MHSRAGVRVCRRMALRVARPNGTGTSFAVWADNRPQIWALVGVRLLHGVVACFTEVQTWPLRACERESQLGRLLMGWNV